MLTAAIAAGCAWVIVLATTSRWERQIDRLLELTLVGAQAGCDPRARSSSELELQQLLARSARLGLSTAAEKAALRAALLPLRLRLRRGAQMSAALAWRCGATVVCLIIGEALAAAARPDLPELQAGIILLHGGGAGLTLWIARPRGLVSLGDAWQAAVRGLFYRAAPATAPDPPGPIAAAVRVERRLGQPQRDKIIALFSEHTQSAILREEHSFDLRGSLAPLIELGVGCVTIGISVLLAAA